MAVLQGKGSMTGVNLVAKVYDSGVTKNGKSHYIDLMIDARDERGAEQANSHLISTREQSADGKVRYNNSAPYSVSQLEEMRKAAGTNIEPLLNADKERVGSVLLFKSNVMPATTGGNGLVVNTKKLDASDFTADGQTMDRQFASMTSASRAARAAREAAADQTTYEPEAEAQADEQIIDAEIVEDEPQFL